MALWSVLVLLAAAAPAPPQHLVLGERAPALLIVALPRGLAPSTPATELSRAAVTATRLHTGLDLRAAEQAGVDAETLSRCERGSRLSCWLAAARPDRGRASAPHPAEAEERAIAAILVINVLPIEPGRDRLALTLIDVERALACTSEPSTGDAESTERVEDCIWERSARTAPAVIAAPEPEALVAFFGARLRGELAPLLDALGELAPFGRIALDAEAPGAELRVDGALAGTLDRGVTVIEAVRPGRRTLALSRPGFASLTVPVEVERARTATVSAALLPLTANDGLAARALLWTGAATAVAGAALGVWAIARSGAVHTTCLVATPDAPCTALGAPTFALSTDDAPTIDRERVNPAGLPMTVPAAGLLGAGAGWVAGTLFELDDPAGLPWRTLLVGFGVGALGAGAAALLDPR